MIALFRWVCDVLGVGLLEELLDDLLALFGIRLTG